MMKKNELIILRLTNKNEATFDHFGIYNYYVSKENNNMIFK